MRLKRAQRPRTPTLRPALQFLAPAAAEARTLGHNYIGTEHLLLVLLASPPAHRESPFPRPLAAKVLGESGVSLAELRVIPNG